MKACSRRAYKIGPSRRRTRAFVALLLPACASTEVRPLTNEASRPGTATGANSTEGFRRWAYSRNLKASAARATIEGHSETNCASHVGCTAQAPPLPACTPPGTLPDGFQYLQGELDHFRAYATTMATEDVLRCNNRYSGTMSLRVQTGSLGLRGGLSCQGDRSGVCCPFPVGTPVEVVGRVVATEWGDMIDDYWICADRPAQAAPSHSNSQVPVALDVESHVAGIGVPGLRDGARQLAWWFGDRIVIWDTRSGSVQLVGASGGPRLSCASLGPRGDHAFTIDVNGTGAIWETHGSRRLGLVQDLAPRGFHDRVEPDLSCTNFLSQEVDWRSDEQALLVISRTGHATAWSIDSNARTTLEQASSKPNWYGRHFSPDGKHAIIPKTTGVLELWSFETGQRVGGVEGTAGVWSPDGTSIAVQREGNEAQWRLWEWHQDSKAQEPPVGCSLEFSPSGRFISALSTCPGGDDVDTFVVRRGGSSHPVSTIKRCAYSVWDAHGDVLAAQTSRGIEVSTRGAQSRMVAPGLVVGESRLAWSPNDSAVASSARIVHPKSGRVIQLPKDSQLRSLAWSPDSSMLATWNLVGEGPHYRHTISLTLRVFDANTGCRLFDLDEPAVLASARQSLVGASPPRWIEGTDVLELPILGSDSFVRLVRPRTGEILSVTLSESTDRFTPLVVGQDGRFEGDPESLRSALARSDAPRLTVQPRLTVGLLSGFLTGKPSKGSSRCSGGH